MENVGIAEVVVLADIPGKNNEVEVMEVMKVVEKLVEGVVRLPKKKWKSRIKELARKKQRGVEEYLRTNLVTCEFHNQLTSTIYCMEEKLGEVCGVGICQRCLEERKVSYGCLNCYKDVLIMLCRSHYDKCITCIGNDNNKICSLFSPLFLVDRSSYWSYL